MKLYLRILCNMLFHIHKVYYFMPISKSHNIMPVGRVQYYIGMLLGDVDCECFLNFRNSYNVCKEWDCFTALQIVK